MLCPIARDTDAYLSLPEAPETERARCSCGRFFSREVDMDPQPYRLPESRCPACAKEHYAALVARSPLLQSIEATRAAHIAMGRIA